MSTSTVATTISGLFTDMGTLAAQGVAGTLAIAIALVGLGFAWRHLTRKAVGKKF